MIIKHAEFIKSAVKSAHYPPECFPEIAFAGRSNVGKSSLINTLINRRNLVKTSSQPGRTQLLNFFLINDALMMVDLPGYGYAKVPRAIQKTWKPMVETYLTTRKSLKGVVLIVDIRRTPGLEENALLEWLKYQSIPCIIVITKSDKLSKTEQLKRLSDLSETLGRDPNELVLFSAKSRQGKDVLWHRLEALISLDPAGVNHET
ncbi:MAG: ribosome biogenesis GTP-binding protein YihA/YsxC [Desulfobacterales bacterium]|jgi:GTP-binding protein|nr:ribosome biogenesis GTP-binding protein YihA/YsxC [Desulfobacterales bacterium]MDD3950963.1 ribosome biogenesis GTP-binding protein YihA/YsxC [Desulfobacterales bacterium]MDD4463805.1 ribosome biogenesis GTP-binding protein YihA/YsxC [Desulfobacterales bacterium]MDY0377309.1 ribosome biogenesis GTP-binding protein YihA/YsxC [Desulfobacterales bacterium]